MLLVPPAAAAAVPLVALLLLVPDERSNAATLCLDRDEANGSEDVAEVEGIGTARWRGTPLGDKDLSLNAVSLPKPLLSLLSSLSEKWPGGVEIGRAT